MDKNSTIGIVLIFAIILGWTMWKAPSAEEQARMAAQADSLAQIELVEKERLAEEALQEASIPNETAGQVDPSIPLDSAELAQKDSIAALEANSKFGIFRGAATGNAQEVVLQNDLIEMKLSTLGAGPTDVILKNYKRYHPTGNGELVQLFDPDSNRFSYRFTADGHLINSSDLYFELEDQSSSKATFRANAGAGKYIELSYRLEEGSYMVEHEVNVIGLADEVNPNNLSLNWQIAGYKNEKGLDFERQSSSVFYRYNNEDREYLSETSSETEELTAKSNWIAFKQKFFTVAMIHDKGFSGNGSTISIIPCEDTLHTKSYQAQLYFDQRADATVSIPMRFYLGPNHIQTLEATEIEQFHKVIDIGWGIFGWMNRWVVIPLFNWLSGFGWGYGIIILVLTFIIKGALFPITWKNYMSSAKMRVLKPEIAALTEKFKDKDPMKKQQATMDLYRKTGVNPMAGCLPALLQMPILYAMFRFFPSSIELRQQSFLWADDLSNYDSILDLPFEIPFYGTHVSLFTLLMAASTFFYTRMNSSQMPTQPGMPNMKVIMTLFPFMMLFIFNSFSSGLSYYYLLANLISIAQMIIIKKFLIDEDKIKLQLEENRKKPKKKSRWMQRMEEIQKQQEQQRKKGRRR